MKKFNKMDRDNRELEGKKCLFFTTDVDSELIKYNNQEVLVKLRKNESEYNFKDVGSVWEVEMIDGNEASVFAYEIEIVNKISTE